MKLKIEMNENFESPEPPRLRTGTIVMITPPINKEYWTHRVPISETQAIVAFPKFGTIGIGFQVEADDWNTNLPYTVDAEKILEHIKKNKGCDVSDDLCIEAIKMLQETITEGWTGGSHEGKRSENA